jgi:SecD/SecF fusion protein
MTNRRRNLLVLLVFFGLVAGAVAVIATNPTVLGLDLSGGIELVYKGQPTPQVPKVTPQSLNDAISTIRKRTDALGVSEPEIEQSGPDQITVGLPNVRNPQRAIQQVGTTARLQFYDWEANVRGNPDTPITGLYQAVSQAAQQQPKADANDLPPGGADPAVVQRFGGDMQKVFQYYDQQNDTSDAKFYLFGPDHRLITGPSQTCADVLSEFQAPPSGATGSRSPPGPCSAELDALGKAGPPPGSQVIEVPRGITVVQAPRPPQLPPNTPWDRYFVVEDDSALSGSDVQAPQQTFEPQSHEPVVTMQFTDRGRAEFAYITRRLAHRGADQIVPPGVPPNLAFQHFAISLDNRVVSLASIDFRQNPEGIDGRTGAQISGLGSIPEAQDLAQNLRIGALPIDLKLISQTQVSASLGQEALHQGLLAGAAGLAVTLIFLLLFYRVLGLVAAGGLLAYAVLLYAVVKLIPITLTLPGIAGLILTLGVAADANIVIFERIKEEVRGGRSVPRAISGGYAKALRTIVDANVVTVGVAFILFMLATAGVKGFAFTLGIGTLVSLLTAVVATSAVLGSMSRTRLLARPWMLGAGSKKFVWRFNFMGASRWFFSMSGTILAAGAIAIAVLGIHFGIDFESGTRITTPLERPATIAQVHDALVPLGYPDARVQTVNDPRLGANVVQIATPQLKPEDVSRVQQTLNTQFGVRAQDFSVNSIGPTFGEQIAQTAALAILASLVLISLYMGLRFEFKFAVPVLIALAHDLLITSGVYALTGREVTSATVAALLTILGYSLYDTIIVFDRIRENVPRMPRATFSQIVNRSMSEVLTRSLVTSMSTLLPILSLLLFGGDTLRDFAFALLIGVLSGTYSSIFIASPVLTAWKEREPVFRRRRRMVMREHGGQVPAYAPTQRSAQASRAEAPAQDTQTFEGQGQTVEQPSVGYDDHPADDQFDTTDRGDGSGTGQSRSERSRRQQRRARQRRRRR